MAIVGPLYDYPHVTDDKTEARKHRLLVQSYKVDIWHGRPGTRFVLKAHTLKHHAILHLLRKLIFF